MEYEIKTIPCKLCGKRAVVGIMSIGSSHQFIQELICPACVTEEHLSRVGTQRPDLQRTIGEAEHPQSGSPHSLGESGHG